MTELGIIIMGIGFIGYIMVLNYQFIKDLKHRSERPLLNSDIMKNTVIFKFSNGDQVKERVSGLVGIVTGSVNYITGCNQHLVTLKPKDDFTEPVVLWYDESRLDLISESKVVLDISGEKPGADKVAPGGSKRVPGHGPL